MSFFNSKNNRRTEKVSFNNRSDVNRVPKEKLSKIKFIAFCILLMWIGLWGRAGYIQLIKGEEYAKIAKNQNFHLKSIKIPRGMITDCNGQTLARSIKCRSVYANPTRIKNASEAALTLASILNRPSSQIEASLLRKGKQFVWIERHLDDKIADKILKAHIPGIYLTEEYKRVYPFEANAGHLLGFSNIDGKGIEGIERVYDKELLGSTFYQITGRDSIGRSFQVSSNADDNSTQNIILTIDLKIQSIAEEILNSASKAENVKWGGMLVVDIPSGDILAWAQYPSFNPNNFRESSNAVYRNRLSLDAIEPGSTFKPFLISAAMKEGLITKNTIFDCENGQWETRSTIIRDDGRAYSKLPVHSILAYSSNIGCAKIGLLLGAHRYHSFLKEMGFGNRTCLPLPESKGILRPAQEWGEADTMSASFGQSLSVTAVQMTQAYLTLANNGVYKPLRITLSPEADSAQKEVRIFSEQIAKDILSSMCEVVESGTGRKASVKGLRIAGKTGTSQKANFQGKYGEARTASFVGIAPADNPKYLIFVIFDEPKVTKYGGALAAPTFHNTLVRILAHTGQLPDSYKASIPTMRRNAQSEKTSRSQHSPTSNKSLTSASEGSIPNVVGLPIRTALEKLASQGIIPLVVGDGDIVQKQSANPTGGSDASQDLSEYVLYLTNN